MKIRKPRDVLSVTAHVPATTAAAYGVIADYRDGHPAILPQPPFVSLEVEEGGRGAGTVIRVEMKVLGRPRTFRAVVTEPDPGRTLVESNDTGYVTTFRVEPGEGGAGSVVTISTRRKEGRGLAGLIEWWLVRRLLRPVFERELGLLADVASQR